MYRKYWNSSTELANEVKTWLGVQALRTLIKAVSSLFSILKVIFSCALKKIQPMTWLETHFLSSVPLVVWMSQIMKTDIV